MASCRRAASRSKGGCGADIGTESFEHNSSAPSDQSTLRAMATTRRRMASSALRRLRIDHGIACCPTVAPAFICIRGLDITHLAARVMAPMVTPKSVRVMSAPRAADIAGVTYRQLDHWSRRGWITASHIERVGDGRKVRRYLEVDVARLATLRHLARSGFNQAEVGADVGRLDLTPDTVVVVNSENEIRLVRRDELVPVVSAEGRWTVFDPAYVFVRCAQELAESADSGDASPEPDTAPRRTA